MARSVVNGNRGRPVDGIGLLPSLIDVAYRKVPIDRKIDGVFALKVAWPASLCAIPRLSRAISGTALCSFGGIRNLVAPSDRRTVITFAQPVGTILNVSERFMRLPWPSNIGDRLKETLAIIMLNSVLFPL